MQTTATKFKRDTHQRAKYFHPDSFKHQGRANLNLLSTLLQHAPAGQLVIDVMGGTGSILIATDYQHPVITGELESHWAPCRKRAQRKRDRAASRVTHRGVTGWL